MLMAANVEKRVAVFDCETEPFDGVTEIYKPFAIGFYDGTTYRRFWGEDAPYDFIKFLRKYSEPLILYAHNGGKFDFLFFMRWIEGNILLINSRITKAFIGIHELRDSYSIIPEPLASFRGKNQKQELTEQEYLTIFARKNREHYKAFILEYLKDDVLTLYEGVNYFRDDFGDALTIGMAALKEFRKIYKFGRLNESQDKLFRHFYFGGRCQCFRVGKFFSPEEPYQVFDVNSMYAAVMKNHRHPVSATYEVGLRINSKTTFACIEAENDGVLPIRNIASGVQSLDFTCPRGKFFAGIHEIEAGLDLGLLRIKKVHYTIEHDRTDSFGEFVDWVTDRKIAMEKAGEDARRNNYKRVGNSCYGKFAQDPSNYSENIIRRSRGEIPPKPWEPTFITDDYTIYSKPTERRYYNNVAIGASITSAARATLLRGLAASAEPHYCDTDSVICKSFAGDVDALRLGAWKKEATGDSLAIAGKKSYVLRNRDGAPIAMKGAKPVYVKMAAKGVPLKHARLSETIEHLAANKDASAEIPNPVPTFKLDGRAVYVTRRIRATGNATKFALTPSKEKVEANKRNYGHQ